MAVLIINMFSVLNLLRTDSLFIEKFEVICDELELPNDKICDLKRRYNRELDTYEPFRQLFGNWISIRGSAATVSLLREHLRNLGLNNLEEKLSKYPNDAKLEFNKGVDISNYVNCSLENGSNNELSTENQPEGTNERKHNPDESVLLNENETKTEPKLQPKSFNTRKFGKTIFLLIIILVIIGIPVYFAINKTETELPSKTTLRGFKVKDSEISSYEATSSHFQPKSPPAMNPDNSTFRDCADIKTQFPDSESGVYSINLKPGEATKVYCGMDYKGGGWTVIQKRGTPLQPDQTRQDFHLSWIDYKNGFGDALSDHWIGLENMEKLTAFGDCELHIDLKDWDNNTATANYKTFKVGDISTGYQLTIEGYTGTAGDAMFNNNGMKFSTKDKDQDTSSGDCAEEFKGAWWFESCGWSNLNGPYAPKSSHGIVESDEGVLWNHWKGGEYSLMEVRMMIRRKSKVG